MDEFCEMRFRSKDDFMTTLTKMRLMLSVAKEYDVFVVCAWGLGAFNNPLFDMVKCWERALKEEPRQPRSIIFSILDDDQLKRFNLLVGKDEPLKL
jgi:hypothetical protein